MRCYFGIIHPLLDKFKWPHVKADEILSSIIQRPPGRPKTYKIREADESLAHKRMFTICYSYCRGIGHNIKGCLIDPPNSHKKTIHILVSLKLFTI